MKPALKLILSLFIVLISINSTKAGNDDIGYHLKFKIAGLQSDTIYLVTYEGNRKLHFDTAMVNANGEFAFKNSKKLKVGMYALIHKGRFLIQYLIGKETNMTMTTC